MEVIKSISDMNKVNAISRTLKAKTKFYFMTRKNKMTYKELCSDDDSIVYFGSCLPQINKIMSMLFYDGILNREKLSGEYRYFYNENYIEKISSRKNKVERLEKRVRELEEELERLKNEYNN